MAEHIDWDSMLAKVKLEDDAVGEITPVLRPCPFCGGINIQVRQSNCFVNGHRYWYVRHGMPPKECVLTNSFGWWIGTEKYTTPEKAIDAWNRRATDG